MNRRTVILLLICFVLAAATVTLRYIESEKEKIKAQFVPPPRIEQKRAGSVTTAPYFLQEQPGGEEGMPAGEQPAGVPPVRNGTLLPDENRDGSQEEALTTRELLPQEEEQGEQRETSMPAIIEEKGSEERHSAVEEEGGVPLEMEMPLSPRAEEPADEEGTDPSIEEDVADEREVSDGEREKGTDADDEKNVSPEPDSEITGDGDEQVPPEEALGEVEQGEMGAGEYLEGENEIEPFEEIVDGEEYWLEGEEEGEEGILLEEGEFPAEEESVSGEGEEVFPVEEE